MRTVAHLITGLEVGGAERMLLNALPRMQDETLQHIVYCITGHGPIGPALEAAGIRVVYLHYRRVIDLPRVAWILYSDLRQRRPHVLVTYLIHADLLGRIVGRLASIPRIISYKRGALLQWEWLKYLDALTHHLVTQYLTVNATLRNELIHLRIPFEKVRQLRNGIDVARYAQPAGTETTIRRDLGCRPGDVVIGIVSALRQGKGHGELFDACAHLAVQVPEQSLRLLVIGDGPLRASLEQRVEALQLQTMVQFLGNRNDIPELLAAMDVFVLPSYFEGMSVALLEAMAARRAIVSTAIPENEEILEHEETALLVPPRDVLALAGAMAQLIRNPTLRARLADRAYRTCINHFSLTNTVTELRRILVAA